ncbi:MAG: DUF3014 domain-containing protein [Gammaproteobacteria bacterium]
MINKPMIGVAAAVLVIAAGTWYYLQNRHAEAPTVAAQPLLPAAPVEPAIEHPVPAAEESAANGPLPSLADSDASLSDALVKIAGASAVKDYLVPESIVRHVVVTIDNLPRQKVAVQKRPVGPVSGSFVAQGDELHATLDAQNYIRYQPLVTVIGKLDTHQLTAIYIRFYPLFQQAYQDLGYPNGYFNDRLVQVIDDLLATPQPTGPIALVRPNVMYTFADPALESRSAGQKLLIRMGPDNAAIIKTKLKELRAAIAASPPKR